MASSHSPASSSSVSSVGSYPGYRGPAAPPPPRPAPAPGSYPSPVYPAPSTECGAADTPVMGSNGGLCTSVYPPVMNNDNLKVQHMTSPNGDHGVTAPPYWEAGEGVAQPHYPGYPGYEGGGYPPVVINPASGSCEAAQPQHGVTVTMCQSGGQSGDSASSRGQHTVHFHVHQGEAVSLQLGGEVQMIQGPATVRMVSTSHEPPVPLPVQVPPGHFVHQIVDENGVLQHVILSQHPTIGYPPGVPPGPTPAPMGPAPATASQNGWQQAGVPGPGQHNGPGYVDPTGAPPPTIQCTAPPPAYWAEGRPSKNSKKRDYADRRYKNGKPSGSSSPSLSVQSTPPQSPVKPRGSNTYNGRGSGGWKGSSATVDDSDESGIGINNDEDQEEKQLLLEILSNIRTPGVPEIRARSALLVWSPPTMEPGDAKFDSVKPIPDSDLEYEVLMSDKGRDGKYRSIFSGASKDCYLTDLRPHAEYHIRVHAVLKSLNLKGGASDTVSFVTMACEPDQPAAPKLVTRSKTSIQLKWNSPNDNGAHIQHFILESDEGSSITGHFQTIFEGRSKLFNVQKLQPSTPYKFRLVAVNELGRSRPSELACYTTQGSAPSQPLPPSVAEVTECSLRLLWAKRPCDDEFTLQMDDLTSGHGFLPQYNGPEVEHIVRGLRRNTSYRFKLRAHNEMGASQYSSVVSYTTKPGRPSPPPKPQTKGKIRSHSFKIQWNVPMDSGGSAVSVYHLEIDDGSGWMLLFSGDELEFVCEQLQPGTQYRVRVAAESAGGVSDYSETCFVTTEPVVPSAPAPPTLGDKPKSNSLHLAWAAPEYDGGAAITEYEIDMTSPDNTTRGVYRGRDTECVVASLLPGRPYMFQVRAQNRAGPGAWSPPLDVISGAGPPDRPKEPRASAKSGVAAAVSWDQPINNGAIITGYRLEMAQVSESPDLLDSESEDEEELQEAELHDEDHEEDGDSEDNSDDESDCSDIEQSPVEASVENNPVCDTKHESCEEAGDSSFDEPPPEPKELEWRLAYSGPDNSTDIRGLVPATQYQLRVAALNSAGCSAYSCNVSMVTPASAPAQPRNLVLAAATSSQLSVKWKRPADHGSPVTGYTVEWGPSDKELTTVTADRKRVNLNDLRPDTAYLIRVQAENAVGRGQFTPFLKVATRPLPPAPPKLECLNVSHNQLKLRWGDSKVQLGTTYILETENSRKQWQQIYSGNNHSHKVSKLTENTEYRYRLCAISEAGQGPFSTVFTFKTTFAPPPPLKGAPRVPSINDSECLVTWQGLKSAEPLQYRVQLTRVKDGHVSTYEAGGDVQLRVAGLDPRSDYTVRVCAVRAVPASPDTCMVGTYSPATQVTTAPRQGGTSASLAPATKSQESSSAGRAAGGGGQVQQWNDQQWAVIILCGFTLFAVVIALVIQQVINFSS